MGMSRRSLRCSGRGWASNRFRCCSRRLRSRWPVRRRRVRSGGVCRCWPSRGRAGRRYGSPPGSVRTPRQRSRSDEQCVCPGGDGGAGESGRSCDAGCDLAGCRTGEVTLAAPLSPSCRAGHEVLADREFSAFRCVEPSPAAAPTCSGGCWRSLSRGRPGRRNRRRLVAVGELLERFPGIGILADDNSRSVPDDLSSRARA